MNALIFIVKTLFELYLYTFILRFALQWVRADFNNPLSQAVVRITNPLVRPLRRVIPGWAGLDMATLVVVIVLELIGTAALLALLAGGAPDPVTLITVSAMRLAVHVIRLFFFAILIHVILSWVSAGGYNPVAAVVHQLCEPLLRPVRRIVPPIGGLDLSALFVLIGLQALQMLIPISYPLV
ncbi:MAG: YggT family protein [Pseudomonadota bacterium]